MTTILDSDLFKHASRAKGKVVVLTGGANGIGKETALAFCKHGAKVVIGDLDDAGGEAVVSEIRGQGGEAAFLKCNVLVWEDLVALFDLAFTRYGSVDIVIPNAGVTEIGKVCTGNLSFDENGRPQAPKLKTLDINLTAVFNTCELALYHMNRNRTEDDLKALVFIGSMASWMCIPGAPQYSASKHAVLGLMRSLHAVLQQKNIRTAVIHPFFADTGIVPIPIKLALAGIPLTPVPRIAGAIFYAAFDPDPATDGCPWLLPDDGPVFRLEKEQLKLGVYELIDNRAKRTKGIVQSIGYTVAIVRDIARILGPTSLFVLAAPVFATLAYRGTIKLPF